MHANRVKNIWLIARLAVWVAFWIVVGGWVLQPDVPSRFLRSVWLSILGVGVAAMAIPPIRRFLMRREKALRTFDLITVNCIVLVVFAELAVLALASFTASPLLAFHDADAAETIRHYRLPAHGVHHGRACNELGLVDDEFRIPRRGGVPRVVALGDSFAVAAVVYEHNFLTLLDDILDSEAREVEVLNFGVSNCGLREFMHLWRTEAIRFEPDLVLLCFFIGNDFVPKYRREKSLLYPSSVRSLTLVRRLWLREQWDVGEQHDSAAPDPEAPTLSEARFRTLMRERLEICRKLGEEELVRRFEPTLRMLDAIQAELGDRLRIVVIPEETQVVDSLFDTIAGEERDAFDPRLPNRRLAVHLTRRGIPFLDLMDALRTAEKGGSTYKPRDTHWNARGNAVAATAIAEFLQSSLPN